MRFVRYGERGHEKPGVLDSAGRVRGLSGVMADLTGDVLADLPDVEPESLPLAQGDLRLGAPVGQVGKYLCIGLNYSDHAAEAGMDIPKEPILFMKSPSSICGANDDVILPRNSTKVDWEVELGVIIGKEAKEQILENVCSECGITEYNDKPIVLQLDHINGKSKDHTLKNLRLLCPNCHSQTDTWCGKNKE